MRKGTSSFVEKSVYGLLNSASKFSGSIANILASFFKSRKYKKIRTGRVEPRGISQGIERKNIFNLDFFLINSFYILIVDSSLNRLEWPR